MAETDTIQVDSPPQTPPQSPPQTPPQDDKVKALYNEVSKDYDLGDYNTFKQKLQDPDKQKAFYNSVGKDYELGTFDEFSKKVSASPQEISDKQKTVNNSQNTIKTAFNDKQVDNFLNKTSEDNLYKSLYGTNKQSTSESQPVPKPDIKILPSDLKAQRDTFKDVVDPNSQTGRTVLESAKDNSKDPNFNNKINAAFYANDRGVNHNPEIHQKIQSGQLGYDLLQKRPTKDVGAGQAFVNGWKQHSDAVNKADYLTTTSPDQIIADEEKKRADNQANVDVPIPKYNGWAKTSNMLGANAIPIAEGAAAAGVVGLADYLTGGAAHPLLAPALGGLFMARDAGKSGASEEFDEQYNNLRDQGVDPQTAYSTAIDKAKVAGALSAAQMAVMSAVGFKSGAKPLTGGFKNVLKQSVTNFAPELAKQIPVMGGFKALENINSGKPWSDDIGSSVAGGAAFMTLIHGVATLPQLFTPKGLNTAINGLANANPELVDATINQLHNQGKLTPDQTQKLKDDLTAQRELNKGLPSDVPEENKQKIKDLIDKRTNLENQLDPEHPDFVDKAYHPDIKEQINGVKKEKADGTTEGKDGINEKIRQLSEPVKQDNDAPLLKTPMDQAKELIASKAVNGKIGNYDASDPETLLKNIAEQAHGGMMVDDKFISSRAGAEETFGPELVNLATKIHPEHIIAEPKEVSAPVSAPEYLLSRHSETDHDLAHITSGLDQHGLAPEGKQEVKDQLAKEVMAESDKNGVPITKIIHSGLERTKETGNIVKNEIQKNGGGDINMVGDPGLNTWDIGDFNGVKGKDFKIAQKYFVAHPDDLEYKGDHEDFKGMKMKETFNQYVDRTIKTHTKYEGEGKGTLMIDHSNNMMVMDAYRNNGNKWDDKAAQDYITMEKPEPASLVKNKNKQNAETIRSDQGQLSGEGVKPAGRENISSENLQQPTGKETGNAGTEQQTGSEQPSASEKGKTEGEEGGSTIGASHDSLKSVAARLGLGEPERGHFLTPEEQLSRGRQLLNGGADPQQIRTDFEKDGKVNADNISVARAHQEILAKATDDALKSNGKDSQEYKDALAKFDDWNKNVIKKMGTESGAAFSALQGEVDVDTGSFTSVKKAFEDKMGRPMTPEEEKTVQDLTSKVKIQDDKITDLQKQVQDLWDKQNKSKGQGGKAVVSYTEKAKAYADAFRKLKTKPFTFKDENGNSIDVHTAGVKWNDIVEAGAKIIEKTGEIADGVKAAIDALKDADWYKALSQSDKDKFATELQSHYEENAPKIAITPEEKNINRLQKKLDDLINGVKKDKTPPRELSDKEQNLLKQISDEKNKQLITRLAGHKGNTFTPEDANDIWNYAKEKYIDKGVTDFGIMTRNVADDLGLTEKQVIHAINQPKGMKTITDEMWRQAYNRRLADANAKAWVKSSGDNKAWKFFSKLYQFPSAIATALHATVLPFTHVGSDAFRITNVKNFLNLEINTWKFAYGSKANYEQGIASIVNDPNYRMWKEAKGNVDPNTMSTDDYQLWSSYLNKIGESGVRAFNAIKAYRINKMNEMWDKVRPEWKFNSDGTVNKKVTEAIANHVNLSTGTTGVSFGDVGNVLSSIFFAPKLVTSQIQRIITEPSKAVVNSAMWMAGKATPEEKLQASMVWRYTGEMMATYGSLLVANAGLLTAVGSNQKINFFNPTQEDWLKFKGHGYELDGTGGLLTMSRFFATMAYHGYEATIAKKMDKDEGKPGDKEATKVTAQLRNKLSPPAQTATEAFFTGTDAMGRPVPWSNTPLTKQQKEEGITKHTWGSYGATKLPIFIAEGFKTAEESAVANGMPESQAQKMLRGFLIGAETGTLGARINPDYQLTKKPKVSDNLSQ